MRDGKVLCVTSVPYPAFIIKDMKSVGYKIINKNGKENNNYGKDLQQEE
jgi:formylmethanofuran dehydrogenase subunit A